MPFSYCVHLFLILPRSLLFRWCEGGTASTACRSAARHRSGLRIWVGRATSGGLAACRGRLCRQVPLCFVSYLCTRRREYNPLWNSLPAPHPSIHGSCAAHRGRCTVHRTLTGLCWNLRMLDDKISEGTGESKG